MGRCRADREYREIETSKVDSDDQQGVTLSGATVKADSCKNLISLAQAEGQDALVHTFAHLSVLDQFVIFLYLTQEFWKLGRPWSEINYAC